MAPRHRAARSYAKALFSLAKERGQVDAVARDLESLRALFEGERALGGLFARPWVAAAAKRAVAGEVAAGAGVSALACDFFAFVAAHGRTADLEAIAAAYRDLMDADAGRVRARVRSAVALDDDARRTLAGRLGRALGGKHVVVEDVLDRKLLGGFVAEIGSLIVDGSLDGELARMRERLAKG